MTASPPSSIRSRGDAVKIEAPKAGIKSTEFWVMLACQVVAVCFDTGIFGSGPVGLAIGGALHVAGLLGYAPGRAKIKAAHVEAEAKVKAETMKQLQGVDAKAKAKILGDMLKAPETPEG